jgi:pre-rRNA-processing protein RIX1
LSRVYDLLQEYPTLVREIATPTLPTCITGCIKIISKKTSGSTHTIEPEGSTSVLQAVLEMFNLLLPIYSTVFRPFSGQLHAIVTPLLAPTQQLLVKGNGLVDEDIVLELARQLFANLHFCAPKNTNGDYWKKSFDSLKEETHLTVDQVFRGIIEDWESSDGSSRPIQPQASYREPMSIRDSPLSLPRFRGVFEGVQRLVGLLQTLRVILASKSATPVQLRLGVISDLISRLTSITAPAGSGSQNEPRINPEIDRFERDAMFCELPKIHIAAMRVLLMLCRRLENGFAPFTNNAIDQVLWIFEAEKDSE